MFGSNNGETMEMLESLYLILSRAMNAWFKFIYALFKA